MFTNKELLWEWKREREPDVEPHQKPPPVRDKMADYYEVLTFADSILANDWVRLFCVILCIGLLFEEPPQQSIKLATCRSMDNLITLHSEQAISGLDLSLGMIPMD